MCRFCKNLNYKLPSKVILSSRTVSIDDNVEEMLGCNIDEPHDDSLCYFELSSYENDKGNLFFGVEYRQELITLNNDKVVISPCSEMIQFNYCPICGKQLSKEIKEFDDYYHSQIYIENEEDDFTKCILK